MPDPTTAPPVGTVEQQHTTALSRGRFRREVARLVTLDAVPAVRNAAWGSALLAVYVTLTVTAWTTYRETPGPFWLTLAVFLALFGASVATIVVHGYLTYREQIGLPR